MEFRVGQGARARTWPRPSPPVAAKPRGHAGHGVGNAPSPPFPVDRRAPLPVFEMEGAQAPVQPLVYIGKDPRRVGEAEVRPPPHQVAAEFGHDPPDTPSPVPSGELSDPLLHRLQGLGRDAAGNHLPGSGPRPCKRRSEEHTSELQSRLHLVCRLLPEKKKPRTSAPRRAVPQSAQSTADTPPAS